MLARRNPLRFDGRIELTCEHEYVLDGSVAAPLSVTGLIETKCSEPFNTRAVILKNLDAWRERPSSRYHAVVDGLSDEEAVAAVSALWAASAQEGTSLHRQLELLCNDLPLEEPRRHAVELAQFHATRAARPTWTPFRTELSLVALDESGRPVVGGQLDLLARDNEGRFQIIDFKRTDKSLHPDAASFGRTLLGYPDNPHHRYSLQCSLYAVMLEAQESIRAESMVALQMHPGLEAGVLTVLTDLRREARELLRELGMAGVDEEPV